MLIICDGGYHPDLRGRRTAVYGFVVCIGAALTSIHQECGVVCRGPAAGSQMAELGAIVAALRWLVACPGAPAAVRIRSDSLEAVQAVAGGRPPRLRRGSVTLLPEAARLLTRLRRLGCEVEVYHALRCYTKPADKLCWKAYAQVPPGGRHSVGSFLRPGLEAAD